MRCTSSQQTYTVHEKMSAKESAKTAHEVLVEIDQLTTKLKKNPKNPMYLCKLASLHLDDGKLPRSKPYMTTAIGLYKENKGSTLKQGMDLSDVMVKYWKADKYSNKADLRINLSQERDKFLTQTHDILKSVISKQDEENAHLLALQLAYLKECRGEFQASLTILSELIAAQAIDKVDLSYIIFKAAILLKHVGQAKQSIEYLEFILDDPPAQDGFSKTHVAAFLAHTYEQSGDKYQVFLPKAYKELQEACAEDMPAAYSKLKGTSKAKFGQGSELWEILALQALDRCEYVLAGEFLSEAISKAPTKAKLIHMLAEIYALLKQKDQARMCAEQAHQINPQSSELRNLLLLVAPEVWTEKLRGLAATTNMHKDEEEVEIADEYAPPGHVSAAAAKTAALSVSNAVTSGGNSAGASGGTGGDGSAKKIHAPGTNFLSGEKEVAAEDSTSWYAKVKARASGALKAIHAGTPIVGSSTSRDPAAADSPTKKGVGSTSNSPVNSRPGTPCLAESAEQPQPQTHAERPKSRSSFVSMLFSSTGNNKAADVASPPKSKAGGNSNSNASPTKLAAEGKGSPIKTSAAPSTGSAKSPSPSNKTASATTQKQAASPTKQSAAPKVKKATKYDLNTPSRLSVQPPVVGPDGAMLVRTTRPEKPRLEKDERKMLDLILSGNENVQIYDPNLAVLHQWRVNNIRSGKGIDSAQEE